LCCFISNSNLNDVKYRITEKIYITMFSPYKIYKFIKFLGYATLSLLNFKFAIKVISLKKVEFFNEAVCHG